MTSENTSCLGVKTPSFPLMTNDIALDVVTANNIGLVKTIHDACLPIVFGEGIYSLILEDKELSRIAYVKGVPVGVVTCRLDPYATDHHDKEFHVTSNCKNVSTTPAMLKTFLHNPDSLAFPPSPQVDQFPINYWDCSTTRTIHRHQRFRLCVLTQAVLKPYRRFHVGKVLMEWVFHCYNSLRNYNTNDILPKSLVTHGLTYTSIKLDYIFLHVWSASTGAQAFYEALGFVKLDLIEGYYKELSPTSSIVFVKAC